MLKNKFKEKEQWSSRLHFPVKDEEPDQGWRTIIIKIKETEQWSSKHHFTVKDKEQDQRERTTSGKKEIFEREKLEKKEKERSFTLNSNLNKMEKGNEKKKN